MDFTDWGWKVPLFLVLLVVSAFFSGSEAALFSLGRYRLQRLHRFSMRKFLVLQKMLEYPTRLISTLLVGNEIVNTAIAVIGSSMVYDLLSHRKDLYPLLPFLSVMALLPITIIFCDLIPKALGIKHTEKIVLMNSYPLWWFYRLVSPIRWFVNWVPERIFIILGISPQKSSVSEDVFKVLVDRGHREGVVDTQERELIHNVLKMDDLEVAQIMTMRDQVTYLTEDLPVIEALSVIDREGFSRYPVLSAEKDRVVGVLYAKDLMGLSEVSKDLKLTSYLRSPLVVYSKTIVVELFFQFRIKRTHFAVVAEEGTQRLLGVVTLEDVLEELFGVLKDERDLQDV